MPVSIQNHRALGARKGFTIMFQKASNTFNAHKTTHMSSLTLNLARPAAHACAPRLRMPGSPGRYVSRGKFDANTI